MYQAIITARIITGLLGLIIVVDTTRHQSRNNDQKKRENAILDKTVTKC